jgi:hypothetical protein
VIPRKQVSEFESEPGRSAGDKSSMLVGHAPPF